MLAARGAIVVDADRIARDIVAPGRPAHLAIVDRFGARALGPDGALDRAALAAVVFGDAAARHDLEAITHPAIAAEMAARTLEHAGTDTLVVLDVPLLEARRDPMAGVLVVDTPEDVAVERLVAHRGFGEADARRRMEAQITRDRRRAIADVMIDNGGDIAHLEGEVERAWAWLEELRVTQAG